jgi:hypothetical protein
MRATLKLKDVRRGTMSKADKNAEIPMGDEQLPPVKQPQFYRTVFKIEVLSEHWADEKDWVSNYALEQIHYAITEGHCSGLMTVESELEVTPKQMAQLLKAQGSDTSFFMLDEQGNSIEEEQS